MQQRPTHLWWMLLSAAVSDKEENLDKKQLELLYRNDRYVYVCVSTYCVHFFPIAITGDSTPNSHTYFHLWGVRLGQHEAGCILQLNLCELALAKDLEPTKKAVFVFDHCSLHRLGRWASVHNPIWQWCHVISNMSVPPANLVKL